MEQRPSDYRVTILSHLASMPESIAALHGTENIADFVLHHLCHAECFDFNKAAYFIDNPDFDHFRGINGYQASHHSYPSAHKPWTDAAAFTKDMKSSIFNRKVRETQGVSHHNKNHNTLDTVRSIAHSLDLKNPQYCWWNLKNDNHGLFIFEENTAHKNDWHIDDLKKGLALFNFCPIF